MVRTLPILLLLGCPPTGDPGDLRPEARAVVAMADAGSPLTLIDVLGSAPRQASPPSLVRLWRRGLDGSGSSCDGRVDVLPLEEYVRGVLPAEWVPSWEAASLESGAIAARTYAAFWVAAGGRYKCADLDDTTWSQVYRDVRQPRTDEAVAATAGVLATLDGALVFAEYSAENGNSTAFGVDDSVCSGQKVNGHGRGICQWGTQRWALAGHDVDWIIAHYYPGAQVSWPDQHLLDGVEVMVFEGERFPLSIGVTNPGPSVWNEIVVASDASPFADPTWISPDQIQVVKREVSLGEQLNIRWWMTAPAVDEPTVYPEFFYLEGEPGEAPGAAGMWQITVLPVDEASASQGDSRHWRWWAGGGGSLAILLFLLGLRARRPR